GRGPSGAGGCTRLVHPGARQRRPERGPGVPDPSERTLRKQRMRASLALCLVLLACAPAGADEAAVKKALAKTIIPPRTALLEVQDGVEAKLPRLPSFDSAPAWEKYAAKLRRDVLDRVVLRGEALAWRKAKLQVVTQGSVTGGKGYKIRKLR